MENIQKNVNEKILKKSKIILIEKKQKMTKIGKT